MNDDFHQAFNPDFSFKTLINNLYAQAEVAYSFLWKLLRLRRAYVMPFWMQFWKLGCRLVTHVPTFKTGCKMTSCWRIVAWAISTKKLYTTAGYLNETNCNICIIILQTKSCAGPRLKLRTCTMKASAYSFFHALDLAAIWSGQFFLRLVPEVFWWGHLCNRCLYTHCKKSWEWIFSCKIWSWKGLCLEIECKVTLIWVGFKFRVRLKSD